MSGSAMLPADLDSRIVARAERCGLQLDASQAQRIAAHARAVVEARDELHLTTIDDVDEHLERHIGESLEGAAALHRTIHGALLDLGSGNGYPALPLCIARPALFPWLVEATRRKAEFLRSAVAGAMLEGQVIERQVQRPEDLPVEPHFAVITTRAMGNWERVLPRLASQIVPGGRVLLWAGERVEEVRTREAWRRYTLVERRALPGRDRSWIWVFARRGEDEATLGALLALPIA